MSNPGRRIRISKAMSWLLRHGAQKEGVEMDSHGYVRLSDLLHWPKMHTELGATLDEVMEEVRTNEKKRFGLLYVGASVAHVDAKKSLPESPSHPSILDPSQPGSNAVISSDAAVIDRADAAGHPTTPPASTDDQTDPTAMALEIFASPHPAIRDVDPSHYFIRAVQGHSIKNIAEASYLRCLSLSDPSSLPATVVHGTFRSKWPLILRSGGLRSMSRNHVHFATGPPLSSVLALSGREMNKVPSQPSTVISGMRATAEILIYVNLRRALSEFNVPFWQSENGVVLSRGIEGDVSPRPHSHSADPPQDHRETQQGGQRQKKQGRKQPLVPITCWDVAVDVSKGGPAEIIWKPEALPPSEP